MNIYQYLVSNPHNGNDSSGLHGDEQKIIREAVRDFKLTAEGRNMLHKLLAIEKQGGELAVGRATVREVAAEVAALGGKYVLGTLAAAALIVLDYPSTALAATMNGSECGWCFCDTDLATTTSRALFAGYWYEQTNHSSFHVDSRDFRSRRVDCPMRTVLRNETRAVGNDFVQRIVKVEHCQFFKD